MSQLLLGARKLSFCITVVNRVPEYVVHKLDDFRGGAKGSCMSRAVSMGRFIQTVIHNNPKQKVIHQQIVGSNSLVKDVVCALLINLDSPFSGFILWVIRRSSAGGDIVLAHDL